MKIVKDSLGVGDSAYFENIVPIIVDEDDNEEIARSTQPKKQLDQLVRNDHTDSNIHANEALLKVIEMIKMTSKSFFDHLKNEIVWYEMRHKEGLVPRLIAIQGKISKTKASEIINQESHVESNTDSRIDLIASTITPEFQIPLYRHPFDSHPPFCEFTPTILYIKALLENDESLRAHINRTSSSNFLNTEALHFNHVLIQYYRSGSDFISEHADKTLDVAKGSVIVNVSFGVTRTFNLKPKKERKASDDTINNNIINFITDLNKNSKVASESLASSSSSIPVLSTQKIKLRNNSMFVLGWETNRYYLHSIPRDKGMITIKGEECYDGERISLTFRSIATYLHSDGKLTGQGARQLGKGSINNRDISANSTSISNSGVNSNTLAATTNATNAKGDDSLVDVDILNNNGTELSPSNVAVGVAGGITPSAPVASNAQVHDRDNTNSSSVGTSTQCHTTPIALPASIPVMLDNNTLFHINCPLTDTITLQKEKERLYEAYSNENHLAGFVWENDYSDGFDVW